MRAVRVTPLDRRPLLVLPSAAIVVGLFLLPIAYFLAVSFWRVRAFKLRPDLTLDQYVQVFAEYWQPLLYTLVVSLAIGLAVTAVGFAFSYYCRFRAGPWGVAFLFVAVLTLFGGYLTKIYTWKTILGAQGILNSALLLTGAIDEPITAFLFNPAAIVLTLTHYTLPFAILPIYGSLRGIEDDTVEAARDLGARPARAFADVVLPRARPGLVAAFALTFLFAAGDYMTPLLVGGPHTAMIGLFIQGQFGSRLNAPLGSAMAFVVILMSLAVIALFALALWRLTRDR